MGALVFNFLTVLGYASSIVGYAGITWVWLRLSGLAAGPMNSPASGLWMVGSVFAGYWICGLVPSWKHRFFPSRRAAEVLRDLDEQEPGTRFADRFQIITHRVMRMSFLVALVALAGAFVTYLAAQPVQHPMLAAVSHGLMLSIFICFGFAAMSRASMRLNEWLPQQRHRSFRLSD